MMGQGADDLDMQWARSTSLPVSNTDIDRTSEPKGHWEDGGKVWVEDHDCSKRLGEWLDIETAPKDGRRVIVWCAKFSAPSTAQWYGVHGWKLDYDLPAFKHQPTHWQPLPEAPNAGL